MSDQSYTYHGPTSGVTLLDEDGEEREVMFYDGGRVKLPPEHPHVVTLVAQGYLVPIADRASKAPAQPAASSTTLTKDGR